MNRNCKTPSAAIYREEEITIFRRNDHSCQYLDLLARRSGTSSPGKLNTFSSPIQEECFSFDAAARVLSQSNRLLYLHPDTNATEGESPENRRTLSFFVARRIEYRNTLVTLFVISSS